MSWENVPRSDRNDFNTALAKYWQATPRARQMIQGVGYGEKRRKERFSILLEIRRTLGGLFRVQQLPHTPQQVEHDFLRAPSELLGKESPFGLLTKGTMKDIRLLGMYIHYFGNPPVAAEEEEVWQKLFAKAVKNRAS